MPKDPARAAEDGALRRRAPRPAERRAAPNGREPAGGKRHQGRVLALQILYEVDISEPAVDEVLNRTVAEQAATSDIRAHVERLVRGVLAATDEIDPYITGAAPAFPLAQLPAIDRTVLRLAVFELLHEPGVPPKAAINEAVELAKRFGGPDSGRVVNGDLGTIVERVRRDAPPQGPDQAAAG